MSGWASYLLIRMVADSVKLRIYLDFKDRKIKVGREGSPFFKSSFFRKKSNIHIHHFIFGMILMPITFIALYWRLWYGPVLVGTVMALIGSEFKELILMNWEK